MLCTLSFIANRLPLAFIRPLVARGSLRLCGFCLRQRKELKVFFDSAGSGSKVSGTYMTSLRVKEGNIDETYLEPSLTPLPCSSSH